MQDSTGRQGAQQDKTKDQLGDRLSEATNDETLSEIERDQKLGDKSKTSDRDIPTPDAQPEQPRKERDDAGPM